MVIPRHLARAAATAAGVTALFVGGLVANPAAQAWDASIWDKVAQCESTGNWLINTGNGYYGGLQFSPRTWRAFGGQQFGANAHQATKAEQIAIARRVLAVQGPGAWPTCGRRAGLTAANGGADRSALPTDAARPDAPSREAARPPASTVAASGVMDRATVAAMQAWLGATADGVWGPQTTRALQARVGAKVDGVRGPDTTRRTQRLVGATPDGVWGSRTTRALQEHLAKAV